MIRQDLRAEPVHRMVVMGESNAYGMNATASKNQWVQVVGQHIREFQGEPLRICNNAQPSNVISPAAPGYKPGDTYRTAPAALERFAEDMIGYRPDLAIYAYGLNDSRCGHSAESFMRAYRHIVTATREQLPGALVVLVGPYWNVQYDAETWSDPKYKDWFGAFNHAGDELVKEYNAQIKQLAEDTGCLFVDVYRVLEGSPWLIGKDCCHFNDVGQAVIGMSVFQTLAAHCSFLAKASVKAEAQHKASVHNTGGTDALPHVVETWRQRGAWGK